MIQISIASRAASVISERGMFMLGTTFPFDQVTKPFTSSPIERQRWNQTAASDVILPAAEWSYPTWVCSDRKKRLRNLISSRMVKPGTCSV